MPVLDDRIRGALDALAPEPSLGANPLRAARRRHAQRRRRQLAVGSGVAALVLAGGAVTLVAGTGDEGTKLDTTTPPTTAPPPLPTSVAPTSTVIGNAIVAVPSVIGSQVQQADQTLKEIGFSVVIVADPTSTAPEGQVVAQQPAADTVQGVGTSVTISVATSGSPMVPDLRGLDPVAAATELTRLGFDVERVDEPTVTVAVGLVTRTDPPAGTPLAIDGRITLFVSSGLSQGTVPQIVSLTTQAAIAAINAAGFKPEAIPSDVPAGATEVGKVMSQTPDAGSRLAKGSTVQFTYGRPTP